MNRTEKEQAVTGLNSAFTDARAVVFTEYKGLTVAEMTDLRVILRKSGIDYKVVKNTLAKRSSIGTSIEIGKDAFTGMVGVAIGKNDPVDVPKKILEYSKKNEKLKVLSGVVEGAFYSEKELVKIAGLPPKEVLLSQMAGLFTAPIGRLAFGLSATVARFAHAMNGLLEKKKAQQ
ncbi:MAG: 50S ribosomal protein L10 [Nitrospirae bacterium]|nr:50S ribosomal protein L10 [Nitrospirota bacterium]